MLKDLKDSTRQRMVAIELDFPPPDVEEKIVAHEAGVDQETAALLVRLGQAIRRLETAGLREVASTRVLVAAGRLISEGLPVRDAARAAVAGPAHRRPDGDGRPVRDDRRVSRRRVGVIGGVTVATQLDRPVRRSGTFAAAEVRPTVPSGAASRGALLGIAVFLFVFAAAHNMRAGGSLTDRVRNPAVQGHPRPVRPLFGDTAVDDEDAGRDRS